MRSGGWDTECIGSTFCVCLFFAGAILQSFRLSPRLFRKPRASDLPRASLLLRDMSKIQAQACLTPGPLFFLFLICFVSNTRICYFCVSFFVAGWRRLGKFYLPTPPKKTTKTDFKRIPSCWIPITHLTNL